MFPAGLCAVLVWGHGVPWVLSGALRSSECWWDGPKFQCRVMRFSSLSFVLCFPTILSILSYRIGQGIQCWWLVLSDGDLFWFAVAAVAADNLLVPDTSGHVCTFWWSTGCLHSSTICFLQHTKPILFFRMAGWLYFICFCHSKELVNIYRLMLTAILSRHNSC